MFQDNIRAFIDSELPVNKKSIFLEHASICRKCGHDLSIMQSIKQELSNIKPLTVSSEFDFRMRSSIRREYENQRNPFYSFTIFFRENANMFFVAPVFAIILVMSIILFNSNKGEITPSLPAEVELQIDNRESVDLVSDQVNSRVEEVHYVLDTVKHTDVEKGIFTINVDGKVQPLPVNNNVTLISF